MSDVINNVVYDLTTKLVSATQTPSTVENKAVKRTSAVLVTEELSKDGRDQITFEMKDTGLLSEKADEFRQSINPGHLLVKNVTTGDTKTVQLNSPIKICTPSSINAYEVRNKKVVPKQNYSKADPSIVNIFAHKGPDENTGVGGMAL